MGCTLGKVWVAKECEVVRKPLSRGGAQNPRKPLTSCLFTYIHAVPGGLAVSPVARMESLRDVDLPVFQTAALFVSYAKRRINDLCGQLLRLIEDHRGNIFGKLGELRMREQGLNVQNLKEKEALVSFLDDKVWHSHSSLGSR
jgi:hypothetical protein